MVQATAALGCVMDADLVRRCLAGDRCAFDALVHKYQHRAAAIAQGLLGDAHDALEVCQNAFLRAFLHLATLDDPGRFGPWFLRIVSNLSLNFRRDRAVGGRRLSLDECTADGHLPLLDRLETPVHSDDRPGASLRAAELEQSVRAALARLPDQQRLALVLFSMEQVPQREVAQMLGCSVEAVKWHVFQARRKLREQLAECA